MHKNWIRIVFGFFFALLISPSTFADVQYNQLTFSRSKQNCLHLNFSIAPTVALYQATLPKQSFPDFVRSLSNASVESFEINLKKAIPIIEKKSILTNQDGSQIRLLHWQWPSSSVWQKSFKEQEALFMSGASSQGHPSNIMVLAEACSKKPINRIQLSFHQAIYPLFVTVSPIDQFWLTDQIPFAIADF